MRGVGLSFCGSQSRAGRSLPQRRPATDVAVGPRRLRPALKLNPKHCTVSASLRLRFRSAVSVARWNFISILLPQNERNPSLSGRATFFCAGQVFRASFFARALAEILFKAHDALNKISYFSGRARVELCAASNCSFSEEKEPKRLQSASLRDALAVSTRTNLPLNKRTINRNYAVCVVGQYFFSMASLIATSLGEKYFANKRHAVSSICVMSILISMASNSSEYSRAKSSVRLS